MTTLKRAIVIVLDGVGAGANPDAASYGDDGASSLEHCAQAIGGLELPHLGAMGLGNITPISGTPAQAEPIGAYGRMASAAAGKDSTTGHWEMTGVVLQKPLPTYPGGFPPEIVSAFEHAIGRRVIGNKAASGTEIIKELGEEHIQTGSPILYTSADSVFQLAAHEEVIPLPELYRFCEIARAMLTGDHAVGRVIARPFVFQYPQAFQYPQMDRRNGESIAPLPTLHDRDDSSRTIPEMSSGFAINTPRAFQRTEHRRDFSLAPTGITLLDRLYDANKDVIGIGKIEDLFAGRGLTQRDHTENNRDGMAATLRWLKHDFTGLLLVNLVEFDMLWGHRRDSQGYAQALRDVDSWIPQLQQSLQANDALFFTADHGVDPTYRGTDHTRECVPLLAYGQPIRPNTNLGLRTTFADLGQTLAEAFKVEPLAAGTSFAHSVGLDYD